jgi:hypothetical protein
MQRPAWALVAATLAWLTPAAARGDEAADLAQIRQQIQQMQQEYEARIAALEKRLAAAEAKAGRAAQQASSAQKQASTAEQQAGQAQAAASAASHQQRGNAFNPDISVILQGRYADLSKNPDTYTIGGFVPPGTQVGPYKQGMSVSESELVFTANADPYFSGTLIGAISPDGGLDAENAYIQTLGLSHGVTLKAGRFFSKVGYLNEQHQHAWDFVDAPLPYRAFLGGQLADDGVQAQWVAPTELLVELGTEGGRGLSFPGSNTNSNGVSLGTLFAHVGGDAGVSNSWRAGLSYLLATPQDRTYEEQNAADATVTNAFTGDTRLWIADFVWKWAPNGNPYERNFKFQSEYFFNREDGTLTYDTSGPALPGAYTSRQSGWYAQAVYQFAPRWRTGLRYDRLDHGSVSVAQVNSGQLPAADFAVLQDYNPTLATAMVDWSPTEFSRFRVQVEQDKSRPNATDNELFLQYILSLGTHGAHTW